MMIRKVRYLCLVLLLPIYILESADSVELAFVGLPDVSTVTDLALIWWYTLLATIVFVYEKKRWAGALVAAMFGLINAGLLPTVMLFLTVYGLIGTFFF